MIIIVNKAPEAERFIEDAAALVIERGSLRVCRDGRPDDEDLPSDALVVVVP